MKFYSSKVYDFERSYNMAFWLRLLESEGIEKITLEIMKTDKECTDFFYCRHFAEVGERGNCGKMCEAYLPRNNKSGICKHWAHCLTGSGKFIEIKRKKRN